MIALVLWIRSPVHRTGRIWLDIRIERNQYPGDKAISRNAPGYGDSVARLGRGVPSVASKSARGPESRRKVPSVLDMIFRRANAA